MLFEEIHVQGTAEITGNVTVGGALAVTGAITPGSWDIADNALIVHDPADPTKRVRIDAGSVGAGQTRVLASPNYDGTIATLAGTETLTGKTLTAPKITAASHIADANGNELINFPAAVAAAISEITVTNAAAADPVSIAVTTTGGPNIGLTLAAAGTGAVTLGQATSVGVDLAADQPIRDSGANELLTFVKTGAAVNQVKVTNAATGTAPEIAGDGDDAAVSLALGVKGTGCIVAGGRMINFGAAAVKGEGSDQVYTAAQVLGGFILRDCNGAPRNDTLPAAADLVAAIPGAKVNSWFDFELRNTSGGANTVTVASPGAPVTLSGTMTVAQNNTKRFRIVLTNVTGGAQAYTCYSMGTVTF